MLPVPAAVSSHAIALSHIYMLAHAPSTGPCVLPCPTLPSSSPWLIVQQRLLPKEVGLEQAVHLLVTRHNNRLALQFE
jgi:hypothetical protein